MTSVRDGSPVSRRRPGRPPRIVVVAQGPPAQGGISSFATTIVDDPVLGERYDLVLLNTTRKAERQQQGGALTLKHAGMAVNDAARVFRAGRSADVVHVQTALMPVGPLVRVLALATAARVAGSRVLVHVHSANVNAGRAEAFSPSRLERCLLRMLAVAHQLLSVSNAGALNLSTYVPRVPVQRFDNAVDVLTFAPRADDTEAAPDDSRPAVLVYVGTLTRRKGMLDLLGALRLLRERGATNWRFEAIGGANEVGDAEASELRSAVADADLADSLLGPLDRETIAAHLARADVFVLPSHWEGQPIAVLEAMAAGLPIVGTRVGAMPDVVREGVDGLLVEPHDVEALADALERVLKDTPLRRTMGRSARERVLDGYDLAAFRRHVATLYDSHLAVPDR